MMIETKNKFCQSPFIFHPINFIQENIDCLLAFLDLIPLPVFIKDLAGTYIACNRAFELSTGFSRAEIIGKNVHGVWPKQQADAFEAQDKALYESLETQGLETQDIEIEVIGTSGAHGIVQFHKKIFYDDNQKAAGYFCILFDITEKKSLEKLLVSQAMTDELTLLANRREGLARFSQVLGESSRKGYTFCVAMLDIDHFKKINDSYGHMAGDEVLKTLANALSSSLREYDICARYGGEEFLICLPNTNIAQALQVLERMRLACESSETLTNDMQKLSATVSMGVVEYPTQGSTIQALLEASDLALYHAKEAGRNRIVYLGKK